MAGKTATASTTGKGMRLLTGLGFALCALFLLTGQARAASGGRYALVIGNSAYSSQPLKNPANDARDVARALTALGFDVQLKTDAKLRDIEDAIRDFGLKLKRGGVGLFYYAGHGVQVQGVNYLVPIGARLSSESDVKYECVDAGRVLGKMEDAGNELNLVILDACRNNPFSRSFRSAEPGLARMSRMKPLTLGIKASTSRMPAPMLPMRREATPVISMRGRLSQ